MRILVLCDDFYHPAEVPKKGLTGFVKYGFEFDWMEDATDWSAQRMESYPVTILTKMNNISAVDEKPWMAESVQRSFVDYVQGGNGLLVLHSGTAGYEQAFILRALIGGVFREHPDQCPVTVEPQAGHPLTEGCENFTLTDEHYLMDLDDDRADVFMNTTSEHGTQPGAWRRIEGDGRVGVLTPGHNLEIWQHPSYHRLILNTLNWCAKIT